MHNYYFILGGEDNEMVEIKRVLTESHILYYQPQKTWGQILVNRHTLPLAAHNKIHVWVECLPDDCCDRNAPIDDDVYIDHHGDWSDRPASLLQVLTLLQIMPTHMQELIASIDAFFLRETMLRWPADRDRIWDIWEQGYRQNFSKESDYRQFLQECQKQVAESVFVLDNVKLIWESPQSMTLLAALCDVEGWDSIQIVGSKKSISEKPCFYQGDQRVVKALATKNLAKRYWGMRYFGCRSVPSEFITTICDIYSVL